jgi:spore germination protein YaaH
MPNRVRRAERCLHALLLAAAVAALCCRRNEARGISVAMRTGAATTSATTTQVPNGGLAEKRLHLWTTACEPKAAEARAVLATAQQVGRGLRTIGLVCYALGESGLLRATGDDDSTRARNALAAAIRRRGVGTVLVLTNADQQGFDGDRAGRVLASAAARARMVDRLVALQARERHVAIELDFEAMPSAAARNLVAAVVELRARLPSDVAIVVDAHAKTVDEPGWQGPGAHDYGALASAGAIVRVMTYDYSIGPVPPGPTTRASWIREVVRYARARGVPSERLEIGLPAYGYDFAPSGPAPLRWREATALAARQRSTLLRDAEGAPHFAYEAQDGVHEVWFDDGPSIGRVLSDLRDLSDEVGGVAIWGAYDADPAVFEPFARRAR